MSLARSHYTYLNTGTHYVHACHRSAQSDLLYCYSYLLIVACMTFPIIWCKVQVFNVHVRVLGFVVHGCKLCICVHEVHEELGG